MVSPYAVRYGIPGPPRRTLARDAPGHPQPIHLHGGARPHDWPAGVGPGMNGVPLEHEVGMSTTGDGLGELSRSNLHFFWIADCSGSMNGSKIESLNRAIRECLPEVKDAHANNPYAQMFVRAIKFGNGASWHPNSQPVAVENYQWTDLVAAGCTDLGAAIQLLATELVPEKIGRRALPPVLVLLSDGQPTDDWKTALTQFNASGWGKTGRTVRVAIAIGEDADTDVLAQFTGNKELVFKVDSAQQLKKVIRWASVELSRSASSGKSQVAGQGAAPASAIPIPAPPVLTTPPDDDTW